MFQPRPRILAGACLVALASSSLASEHHFCKTSLTTKQAETFRALQAAGVYDLPPRTAAGPPPTIIIPVAIHVVRQTDGTGHLSQDTIDRSMLRMNLAFAPAGMVFRQAGPTDYIDDDALASDPVSTALRVVHVVPNAVNVWTSPGLNGGLSSFTGDPLPGITLVDSFFLFGTDDILAHEMGHYFDLFHTHETFFGDECVDGSNCAIAGDLLCDTPADPGLNLPGRVMLPQCTYIGTVTDPCAGLLYNPDMGNIMSYEPEICHNHFTPQQIDKARATLLNLRPELMVDNDCDDNGTPDACELYPALLHPESGTFTNVFSSSPDAYLILSPPATGSIVVLTFAVRADLGAANEWIDIDLNGVPAGRVFEAGGSDCPAAPNVEQLIVPAATWNNALAVPSAGGSMTINIRPSPLVVSCFPQPSDIIVMVDYLPAAPTDLNGNGALDACEPDCNTNGTRDHDDVQAGQSQDCNSNDAPDACDLAVGGAATLAADFQGGLPSAWTATGVFHVTSLCGGTNTTSFAYAGRSNLCKVQPLDVGQLTSPPVTIPQGAATLRYRERYRSTNSARTATLRFGDWELNKQFFGDGAWYWREIDLRSLSGQTGSFTFTFNNASPSATSDLGWQVDDIRLTAGSADCNGNALLDDCETAVVVSSDSGMLTPFGAGFPQSVTFAQAPRAQSDVTLTITASADLGLGPPSRHVRLSLNGVAFFSLFLSPPGHSCPAEPDFAQVVVPRDDYNARLAASPTGDAVFTLSVQGPADPLLCNPSFITLRVDYRGATGLDANLNLAPDVCEQPGDLNCDLAVNGADIQAFLRALTDPALFAALHPGCDAGLGDFNDNGAVDSADIAPFVGVLLALP
jgi:hypothetical protein